MNTERRPVDMRFALIGGLISTVGLFAGTLLVGRISPYEATSLVRSILPTTRFFVSASLAAGTTVLALMLTLLGITYSTDLNFAEIHYRRIKQVSLLSSIVIVMSVVLFMILGLPVEEADELRAYHQVFYYVLIAAGSVLSGMMISVVLMLHRTIYGLVAIGHPQGESELIHAPDAQEHQVQ